MVLTKHYTGYFCLTFFPRSYRSYSVIFLGIGHAVAGSRRIRPQPTEILVDPGVNSRGLGSSTSYAPGDDPRQLVLSRLLIEGRLQGASTVATAGVLAPLQNIPCTHHVIRDLARLVGSGVPAIQLG